MLTNNNQGGHEDGIYGTYSNHRCDLWPNLPDDGAVYDEKAVEKELLQIK